MKFPEPALSRFAKSQYHTKGSGNLEFGQEFQTVPCMHWEFLEEIADRLYVTVWNLAATRKFWTTVATSWQICHFTDL